MSTSVTVGSFCTNCGNRVSGFDRFCNHCGKTLAAITTAAPSPGSSALVSCPFCAEAIQAAASKCRFCGSFVTPVNGALLRQAAVTGLSPYYRDEFQKIEGTNEGYRGKWNWAAFCFGAIWALTKGLWLPALICFIGSLLTGGVVGIVYWFIFGARGNYMYFCKVVRRRDVAV